MLEEPGIHFHGFASAVKTRDMGVRVELEEGEPLADALKRLRVLLHEEGGHPIFHAKWHKRRLDRYEKPSVLRRRRRWVAIEKRIQGWAPSPEDLPILNSFLIFELRPRRLWPQRSVAPDRIRRRMAGAKRVFERAPKPPRNSHVSNVGWISTQLPTPRQGGPDIQT